MNPLIRTFEIRLPKEFIRENTPDWESLDFKLFIKVNYWFDEVRKMVLSVEQLFDLCEFIKWEHPRLRQYLMAAAQNNHENTLEGIANPQFMECIN